MDPAYLEEIVEGLMRVHVRHAIGLQPQGDKGECNPFVTVALGPGAGALLQRLGKTHALQSFFSIDFASLQILVRHTLCSPSPESSLPVCIRALKHSHGSLSGKVRWHLC